MREHRHITMCAARNVPNANDIIANEEEFYTIRMGLGLAVALGIWSQCTYGPCVAVYVCALILCVCVCACAPGHVAK